MAEDYAAALDEYNRALGYDDQGYGDPGYDYYGGEGYNGLVDDLGYYP